MKFILLISLPLYAVDQITKWLILQNVHPDDPHDSEKFFNLVNVTNTGAAFGSFKNNNTFFMIVSGIALFLVTTLLLRRRSPDALRDISLALLLAGIVGNLTDRLLHGHVIDFLLFNLHLPLANPWPAFNVADSCICIAVACFIAHSFKKPRDAAENPL